MPPLPCIEPDDEVVNPEEELWKKELAARTRKTVGRLGLSVGLPMFG